MTFKEHLTILRKKLARVYGIFAKVSNYIFTHVLKSVYYSIFDCLLKYAAEMWGQDKNCYITAIYQCQNKTLGIINFDREPIQGTK